MSEETKMSKHLSSCQKIIKIKWQHNLISYFETMSDDLYSAKLRSTGQLMIHLTQLNRMIFFSRNIVCSFFIVLQLVISFQYITVFQSLANV